MTRAMQSAGVTSRFAPSPTGRLHLGHAFSAIRAHDFARAAGGRFLLRIEDIDPGRTREEFVVGIVEDLAWLRLDWDGEIVRQSQRLSLYAEALDRLKAMGLVYPCFCSRAEIAASAAAPHDDGPPLYPGTCRRLIEPDLSQPHCWRLDMAKAIALSKSPSPLVGAGPFWCSSGGRTLGPAGLGREGTAASSDERAVEARPPDPLSPALPRKGGGGPWWHDRSAGWIEAEPASHGDVVLARRDAPVSYHLAVTVDDAVQGISDVVRGADLFAATHVHRLLQALLDLPTPNYHHHPLLAGPDGRRLAKRDGARSLAELRARGADPIALAADLRANRFPTA